MNNEASPVLSAVADDCRLALDMIEQMLPLPPLQVIAEADKLEQTVAHMRDTLIDDLRRNPSGPDAALRRDALDSVNAALSLVLAVEFPGAGLDRKPLELVRHLLRPLLVQKHS